MLTLARRPERATLSPRRPRLRGLALALAIALSAPGCSALESDGTEGDHSTQDAAAQSDDGVTVPAPAAGTAAPASGSPATAAGSAAAPAPMPALDPGPTPTPPTLCSVGTRATGCCPVFEARLRTEADADPCWFEYPGIQGEAESERYRSCTGFLPDCGSTQCQGFEPPSRLAGLVTPDGQTCTFADECSSDTDCVLAFDASTFCPCPRSTPAVLLAEHACQLPAGTPSSEIPEICDASRFTGGACGPCADPSPPRCVPLDGLRRCM